MKQIQHRLSYRDLNLGSPNLKSGAPTKGVTWGVLTGVPVTPLLQASFNQTTYNRWRKCHDDTLAMVTIWWVPSLWHSVTPLWKILATPLAPTTRRRCLQRILRSPDSNVFCFDCLTPIHEHAVVFLRTSLSPVRVVNFAQVDGCLLGQWCPSVRRQH